jgi:flagellar biosynthetic protein FliQ
MSPELIVALGQRTLQTAVMVAAPLLLVMAVVSLLISVVQTLTSLQDSTIASVPRLLVAAVAVVVLMPWMLRKLAMFTTQLLGDFRMWTQ